MVTIRMTRPKQAPQRTCVGCGAKKDQRLLVRIVRGPESGLIIGGGRVSGRGAYICPASECWKRALKGTRLEHCLRSSLTIENRAALLQYLSSLQESEPNGKIHTE